MTETNKCEGKQVTNEEIMEHLKEIEEMKNDKKKEKLFDILDMIF